ncbi:MAG: YihA family ribosome biogenesis GTP-binding protein [Flavobacteriales bacterium]|nr:YihA family ribosome biogenesis GTP-binding protein [Flavobacteriales bacterium]
MVIKSVEFIKSSSTYKECPSDTIPEYAFIGRSNVGKSSLINMLAQRKKLAKTSSTPGKTQLINHFSVEDENYKWFLTDLPGYGYAKVSKSSRKEFHKLITNYILNRKQLVNLFILIDSRHDLMQIDKDFIEYVGENQVPFSIVFTKKDKVKSEKFKLIQKENEEKLLSVFSELPPIFVTSSEKKLGREELLNYIAEVNAIVQNQTNE